MNSLPIFLAVLATAASYPIVKTWTLSELSKAIETSKPGGSLRPHLEEALNQIMVIMFTGKNEWGNYSAIMVLPLPSGGTKWTLAEVTGALADRATRPEYRAALSGAYDHIERNTCPGKPESVQVAIPALDISTWTQSELYEAILSPNTKPELRLFLEKARSELKKALNAGEIRDTVYIVTPVGMIPPNNAIVSTPKPTST